jgi:hypothetical protein
MIKLDIATLVLIGSAAMGFGLGSGLALSKMPFVLEATNTPIGSFVLRGNVADNVPLPKLDNQVFPPAWAENIA